MQNIVNLPFRPKTLAFAFSFTFVFLTVAYGHLLAQEDMEGSILPKEYYADSLKVEQEIEISRNIHRNEHNEDLEYQHAENAIAIALRSNSPILYARALDNLGLLYRYHQMYQEAISLHVKAFNLIKNQDDDLLIKMICANNA